MKKRPDGRFCTTVYLPGGQQKMVYGKTQKETRAKAEELKLKIGHGIDVSRSYSFEQYRGKWLDLKSTDVSAASYKGLESISKNLMELYWMDVKDIRAGDVRKILNAYAKKNPHTGKPTSSKTLSDMLHSCQQILDLAVEDRLIESNPARLCKVPKGQPKAKREPITQEQMRWIRETPDRCQAAAMVMLYAGLRRSEAGALTIRDLDFSKKTISVTKRVVFNGSRAEIENGTKSPAGTRLVTMPDLLCDYLNTLPSDHRYIITHSDTPWNKSAWKNYWDSYMVTLDLKYGIRTKNVTSRYDCTRSLAIQTFTPHQLRHTYATMLYAAGVDVLTAQKLLGHEDIKTTLGIYTHLESTTEKRSINRLNEYIS